MILGSFFDFKGAIDLFDENETGHLMGEGEWGKADKCGCIFFNFGWQSI